MPNPEQGTDGAAAPAAGTGTGNTSGTPKPDAHLAPLLNKLSGIESLLGRFGQRLGTLEQRTSAPAARSGVQNAGFPSVLPEDETDPQANDVRELRQELDEERRERAVDRFLRVSGVSPEDFQQVVTRLQADETRYHRFDGKRRMDYYNAYMDVWKDIRLERIDSAQQAGQQQRTEQDQQRNQAKNQAVISGAGAVGTEQDTVIDVSKMTSAELLNKVLIPNGMVDPNDVPSDKPYLG